MLTSQQVPDLLAGVSQQPQGKRAANQLTEQVNAISPPTRSVMRRPGLQHVAKLTASFATSARVFVHEIVRSQTEQYHAVIADGVLKVFDAFTGAEQAVYTPNGTSYLNDVNGFRALTVGDSTIIVNRGITPQKGTTLSTDAWASPKSLVVIVQGDYSTSYTIKLAGITITYTTPANTGTSSRSAISSDAIASVLTTYLGADPLLSAAYTFTRYGSTIVIAPIYQGAYSLSTTDGLGDKGMLVIRGAVQRFTDLPARAEPGYVVEVVGDQLAAVPSYYVRYDESATPGQAGVWHETTKPATLLDFNKTTMPHRLVRKGTFMDATEASGTPPTPTLTSTPNVYTAVYTFSGTTIFPAGTVITFTLDTIPLSYTVLDGDELGTAVCAGIKAVVDAHANYTATNPTSSTIQIVRDSHAAMASAVTVTFTGFHNHSLSLVPNSLAGQVIKNTTDGSEGTVLYNTTTTIQATLSGGGRNTFRSGDICTVVGVGNYFVFRPAPWDNRAVGTPESAPYPSFVGGAITDTFLAEGRLGFISRDNVVFSRAGSLYNFFRQTITDVLSSDPVDVSDALHASAGFHSVLSWQGKLYLWSDTRQYVADGDPVVSPQTIRLKPVTEYSNLSTVRPVVAGNRMFFLCLKNGQPHLMDYHLAPFTNTPVADDVSEHAPSYITGVPIRLVADDALGIVIILTTTGIFVYNYRFAESGNQRVQSAWHRWTVPPLSKALDLSLEKGTVSVITQHSDGLYLNTLGLDQLGSVTVSDAGAIQAGPLATIVVSPSPVTVKRSTTQQFTAVGRDAQGNNVPVVPVWSVAAGGGTIDASTGVFTAGIVDGTYTNTVTATVGGVSGTATVVVVNTAVASIAVTPTPASIAGGQTVQFSAVAKDASGNVLVFTPTWSVIAGGGTISATGLFTAGNTAGTFTGTVKCASGAVFGVATVTVVAGPLASITLTPNPVAVGTNATQAMTAVGKDAVGITVPITPTWSVVNGGGTISAAGVFTAGNTPGTYSNTIRAAVGSISATVSATVSSGALASIVVSPNPGAVGVGGTQQMTAIGYDANGAVVAITPTWSVVNGGGSISVGGLFTAGASTGTYTNTVRATSGAVNGYATIAVSAGAPDHITVLPSSVALTVTQTQQMSATLYDAASNTITSTGAGWVPSWLWNGKPVPARDSASSSTTHTITFASGISYVFGTTFTITCGATDFTYTVSAATETSEYIAAQLTALVDAHATYAATLSAQVMTITAGAGFTVNSAVGVGAFGYKLDCSGLLTAGTRAVSTFTIQAAQGTVVSPAITGSIVAGALATISISPSSPQLAPGASVTFQANGFDAYSNAIPLPNPTWTVVAGGGTFNTLAGSGVFVAGSVQGTFSNTIAATYSGITGYTSVTVKSVAGPLAYLSLGIGMLQMSPGASYRFHVTGYDFNGNVVPLTSVTWQTTALTDILTPVGSPAVDCDIVAGNATGLATLIVSSGGVSLSFNYTVSPSGSF